MEADRFLGADEEMEEGEILMMMDSKEFLKEKLLDNDFFNDFEDDFKDDDLN